MTQYFGGTLNGRKDREEMNDNNNHPDDRLVNLIHRSFKDDPVFKPGKKLPIYLLKVEDKESIRKRAYDIATKIFKLNSKTSHQPEVVDRDDYLLFKGTDDLRARYYFPSNHFSFYKEKSIYSGKSQVTHKKEGQRIARRFLNKQPVASMLGNKHETAFEELRFIKGIGVNREEKEATKPILHNTVAIFSRIIEGKMRLTGPGSRVVVFIGEGKDVIGLKVYAREILSKFETVIIDPPDIFIDEVATYIKRSFGANGFDLDDIKVDKFECAYFAQGKHVLQRFYQPAYVIGYTVKNKWMNSGNIIIRPAHSKEEIESLEGPAMNALAEEEKKRQQ